MKSKWTGVRDTEDTWNCKKEMCINRIARDGQISDQSYGVCHCAQLPVFLRVKPEIKYHRGDAGVVPEKGPKETLCSCRAGRNDAIRGKVAIAWRGQEPLRESKFLVFIFLLRDIKLHIVILLELNYVEIKQVFTSHTHFPSLSFTFQHESF